MPTHAVAGCVTFFFAKCFRHWSAVTIQFKMLSVTNGNAAVQEDEITKWCVVKKIIQLNLS